MIIQNDREKDTYRRVNLIVGWNYLALTWFHAITLKGVKSIKLIILFKTEIKDNWWTFRCTPEWIILSSYMFEFV